ncbi:MAG: DUF6430 domain-containing protein [Actinomycetota bacterium]|nr:DUF6430 domain-containing protein [Actinomycetota bacterium]
MNSPKWFGAIILCSVIYGTYRMWRPAQIVITAPLSNVSIEVVFGDIFAQEGVAAIPVNEFFDSEIGLPVSKKSLHGMFLQRCFAGHGEAFDRQVADKLGNIHPEVVSRREGKGERFPIGTSAALEVGRRRYLLFAFTRTDTGTCKASADVPQMFAALAGLWRTARTELGGDVLNVPLVGSGLSGVGLPTRDLLNMIILSFLDETRRQIVVHQLRVVLGWDRLPGVDLREVKRYWEAK